MTHEPQDLSEAFDRFHTEWQARKPSPTHEPQGLSEAFDRFHTEWQARKPSPALEVTTSDIRGVFNEIEKLSDKIDKARRDIEQLRSDMAYMGCEEDPLVDD